MNETRWRNFDEEKRKNWDQLFLRVALEWKRIGEEEVHEALRRQQAFQQRGAQLSIGQVLLKMRAIGRDDFLRIQKFLEKATWTCPYCTAVQFLPSTGSGSTTDVSQRQCRRCGKTTQSEESSGVVLGNYELLARVAHGGMGTVYRARHTLLNRIVALKILHKDLEKNPKVTRRFRREWELAAKLRHPNIVPVLDAGVVQGRHFYTMEYVAGTGLNHLIRHNQLTPQRAVEIICKVARALDYAHREGVLHRDVKPSNILIDAEGKPYLVDFGIARSLEEPSELTKTGTALGTLYYMAPEQARGQKDLDERCDVYSLGATLFEALTGKKPFEGDSYGEVYLKILESDPLPPRSLRPDLAEDLEAIVLKAMAKDRRDRYESCAAMAEDLERYLQGKIPLAMAEKRAQRQRHLLHLAGGALVGLVFLWMTLGLFFGASEEKPAPVESTSSTETASSAGGGNSTATATVSGSQSTSSSSASEPSKEQLEVWKERTRLDFLAARSFFSSSSFSQVLLRTQSILKRWPKERAHLSPIPLEQVYFLRALAFYKLRKLLEAKKALLQAVDHNPSYGPPHLLLTLVAHLLGEEELFHKFLTSARKLGLLKKKGQESKEFWRTFHRLLSRSRLYWNVNTKNFALWGKGPEWHQKVVYRTTEHFSWTIYYKPVSEIEWIFPFAEKVYSILEKRFGLRPTLSKLPITLSRERAGFVGYTHTSLGEVRFFSGNLLPFFTIEKIFIHTVGFQFLVTSISPSWPIDWWDSQYGAFFGLLTVQVFRDIGKEKYAQSEHEVFVVNPMYRLFEKWTRQQGWTFWRRFFQYLHKDGINLYVMAQEYPWKRRSLYLSAYLSLALGRNVAMELQQAGLGKEPDYWKQKWPTKKFQEYSISPQEVEALLRYRSQLLRFKNPASVHWKKSWEKFQNGYVQPLEEK